MAQVKAYPKGSIEAVEWTTGPDVDIDELGVNLGDASLTVTFATSTGWAVISVRDYAAFEIVV